MVKSEHRIAVAAIAVILLGITSTQAEAPLDGYDSYASNGGYASSPGYAYGPPKEAGIPGRAGVDYPAFTEVPQTSFSCDRQPLPGYYADPEAGCQVYHVCEKGVKEREPMLCPVGSIFDQEKLTCAWWYTVDCARSAAAGPAVNAEVVAAMEEADALAKANKYGYGRGKPSGAYGPPSNTYGPPSGPGGIPLPSYVAPAPFLGGSSGPLGGPSVSYGVPSSTYGAPSGFVASPRRVYGAPARGIGGLFNGAGSLRRLGSLSRAYGAPPFGGLGIAGGAPRSTYGVPTVGSPSQEYGVPGGREYLPPSF